MANCGETGVVVRSVMGWMLRRGVEKEPVEGYKGTHFFKARGGGWFRIGVNVMDKINGRTDVKA